MSRGFVERTGSVKTTGAVPTAPSGARVLMSPADFKRLASKTEIYSVHPDVLQLLSNTESVRAHVSAIHAANKALPDGKAPQTEVLLFKLKPDASMDDVRDVATMLHTIRGKELPVPQTKLKGLMERGFMVIYEPDAIYLTRRIMQKNIIESNAVSSLSV